MNKLTECCNAEIEFLPCDECEESGENHEFLICSECEVKLDD